MNTVHVKDLYLQAFICVVPIGIGIDHLSVGWRPKANLKAACLSRDVKANERSKDLQD